MTLPVLTAVTGAAWESALVAALERDVGGVSVVRRCVDLADLLAAAAAGTARAALLSPDLRRLDRDALTRLAATGVVVVGIYAPGDEEGEIRLRQLGLRTVLAADLPVAAISAAVTEAVTGGHESPAAHGPGAAAGPAGVGQPHDPDSSRDRLLADLDSFDLPLARPRSDDLVQLAYADPAAALPAFDNDVSEGTAAIDAGSGRLVAVWGPAGAPGRSTLALNLAAECAALGEPTLLADADVYGAALAQLLGMLDESPGLAAAARLAVNGNLDLTALAKAAPFAARNLRVLTGISRADRWPELRPVALDIVWSLARSLAAITFVDCGFSLEQDEELSFDTAAPRRNGATLVTLQQADTIIAVAAGDPVGMQRMVRVLPEVRDLAPDARIRIVVNKVRKGPVGAEPEQRLREALERYAGADDIAFVPYDRNALDAALLQGGALHEVAASSPARAAVADLARDLAGRTAAKRGRRAGICRS